LGGGGKNKVVITIDNGEVKIADHTKISCKRIWIRFGGNLTIDRYTNINSGSEIRCDEAIDIGSFNQISYNVCIWDTNTHTILTPEERRKVTMEKYPYFGYESTRPQTAKISIGNDCWIGEDATIFKGTIIGDGSVIGYGTLVANKNIPANSRVVNRRELSIDNLR
jgi:maltose O-acetyltransferase